MRCDGTRRDTLLVVDDDPGLRTLLEAYLGDSGFAVETAMDGPAMWQALEHGMPDAIVLDLLAARTMLLAGVSHDLRMPLARLRLAVEMLVEKPSTELAAQVEGDIEAMDRLIDDVLTLARGFGHEVARRVALADLLADLVRSTPGAAHHVQIEAADITLEVPVGALRRILANLLESALRYGGGWPVTLQAGTGNGLCRIGVLDHGPGFLRWNGRPCSARSTGSKPRATSAPAAPGWTWRLCASWQRRRDGTSASTRGPAADWQYGCRLPCRRRLEISTHSN